MEHARQAQKPGKYHFTLKFIASDHGEARIVERSKLSTKEVEGIINSGRALLLGKIGKNNGRSKYLFWSPADDTFKIAVVGVGDGTNKSHCIMTLLTLEQHENDIGDKVSFPLLNRAAAMNMSEDVHQRWLANNYTGQEGCKRHLKVRVVFLDPVTEKEVLTILSCVPEHVASAASIAESGVKSLSSNNDFLRWVAKKIASKTAIDLVKSIEISVSTKYDQCPEFENIF
jgi:hypothetical protein